MKKTKLLLSLLITFVFFANAFANNSVIKITTRCPVPKYIKYKNGVYTAQSATINVNTKRRGRLDWSGVVQQRSVGASPHFIEALYTTHNAGKTGEITRCSYMLNNGKVLDMRLTARDNIINTSIVNNVYWVKRQFNADEYLASCDDKSAARGMRDCKFYLMLKK